MGIWDKVKSGVSSAAESVGDFFSGDDEKKKKATPVKDLKQKNQKMTQEPKTDEQIAKDVGQQAQEKKWEKAQEQQEEQSAFDKFMFGPDKEEITPEERRQKIQEKEQEIKEQEAAIEEGDDYQFIRDRQEIIEQKEEEKRRLEKGLDPERKIITGNVPISPAGSAAGAINTFKNIGKGGKAAKGVKNIKKAVKTKNWLKKLNKGGKFPTGAASALVGAIGSYPFAGFIKEEALQTLGMGAYQGLSNNNPEAAEIAIEKQKEALNPDTWDKILSAVPYANVINELKNFYSAAQTKNAIDERLVKDMKEKQQNNESEDDFINRVEKERKEEEKQDEKDFVAQQKKILKLKKQAREDRKEYWEEVHRKNKERKEKEREARLEYWEKYWERKNEIMAAQSPSQLNFGLL